GEADESSPTHTWSCVPHPRRDASGGIVGKRLYRNSGEKTGAGSCSLGACCLRDLQGYALLLSVSHICHVCRDCRPVSNLYRCIRSFTAANAVDPVRHVILVFGFAINCRATRPIQLLRQITYCFL